MRRGTIFVIIFILLAVGVISASQFMRSQAPLEITVAVTPLAEGWVRSAVDAFNATEPVVNGTRRIFVRVNTIDDLSVWTDEGTTRWTPVSHPQAWIPAATLSLSYANRQPFETVTPSLVQTVLVWGGFADRVDALTDSGAHPLDWSDIASAAAAGRWQNIPGGNPNWNNVTLAFSRPDRSISGLSILFSGAAALGEKSTLDSTTLQSNDFRNWMVPILQSVPSYNTLGASVAQTLGARGASIGDFALLPESEWLTNLRGTLVDSSNPIRLSYPAYEFVFDFPLARWQGMTADENAAVDAFGHWLVSQPPEAFGLRPASGVPAPTARLFSAAADNGVQLTPDLSKTVQVPSRADTQRLLLWVTQTLP